MGSSTVFSVALNSDSEILAALQKVDAGVCTQRHRLGAEVSDVFGCLDVARILSGFESLLIQAVGCHHYVAFVPRCHHERNWHMIG